LWTSPRAVVSTGFSTRARKILLFGRTSTRAQPHFRRGLTHSMPGGSHYLSSHHGRIEDRVQSAKMRMRHLWVKFHLQQPASIRRLDPAQRTALASIARPILFSPLLWLDRLLEGIGSRFKLKRHPMAPPSMKRPDESGEPGQSNGIFRDHLLLLRVGTNRPRPPLCALSRYLIIPH
jgi:hypothetical protein